MNRSISRAAIGEFLFWLHLGLIVCAVLSGLVLPLLVVVAAIIVHRLHMLVFNGCVLTVLQKRFGMFPSDINFLQKVSHRLFGRTISPRQSARLDHSFAVSCLVLAVARHLIVT